MSKTKKTTKYKKVKQEKEADKKEIRPYDKQKFTFVRMLKFMVLNPKAKFRSWSVHSYEQNLGSIIFWLEEYAKDKCINSLNDMMDAKDWELECLK